MADAIATTVVEKVVENLVDRILNFILNPITVVRKCNDNVENLKSQVKELKKKRNSVERYIEDVGRRGEEIGDKDQSWLTKADEFNEVAEESIRVGGEFAKECFFRLCPNPLVRYKLSKKVAQITEDIAKHVLEAPRFDLRPFHAPPPQEDMTAVVYGFEEFPSRMAVLEKIMEALKNPIVNTVGLHGTSGVGKTMLVKMVKRKAKQDSLFTAVVMATVTKDRELKSIQEDIARDLGMDLLSFRELTDRQVADRIKEKLKNVKKFLVILDDVWETEIDFEKVGIPSASELKQAMEKKNEGSSPGQEDMLRKILITSRLRDVLSGVMGEKDQVFEVLKLDDDEGWHLFKKTVGSNLESSDFQPTAKKIVERCLGLPVAIATVGKAMKGKTQQHQWLTALVDLRKPTPEGISAAVYKPIELSYNYLQGHELKQTFMLCSLLGHDSSINDLLKYGMGLNLFPKVKTIEETRAKVLTLVLSLKQSSLLVDGHSNMHFGMHDQIREIALSIAARYHCVLALVDEDVGKEWPEKKTMKKLKWIYLSNGYPAELTSNRLKCPQLTFFHFSNKGCSLAAPTDLFAGTEGLKVLCLTKVDFQSIPVRIPLIPTKLHTLLLDQCVFTVKELGSIVRNLESLEVLSLAGCDIEEFPREIEKMSKLKLLDVSDCTKLKVVPPQVLARLSKLEELKMGNSFDGWDDVEKGNARLAELTKLHKLTALEVRISNFQETSFPENLERFKIFIGIVVKNWNWHCWNSDSWESSFESSKIMKVKLQGASIKSNDSIKKLLKKTEELYLEGLNGVENLVYELNDEGFQHLKCLHVQNAPDISHIFNRAGSLVPSHEFRNLEALTLFNLAKMKKICDGLTGAATFKELKKITVVRCRQLKNLFSFSMARQLQRLQEIIVEDCNNIEQIIDDVEEQGNGNDIVEESEGCKLGNSLRSLKLRRLPKLIGFNSNCSDISLFNDKVIFPNLEELHLSRININQLWIIPSFVEHSQEIHSFKKLKSLRIYRCSRLEYLFTFSMVSCLKQLEDLHVSHCEDLKQVMMVRVEEVVNTESIFPRLNSISLAYCYKLSSFPAGRDGLKFQSTTKISIIWCPNMITFASTFSTEQEKETAYQEIEGRSGQKESDIPNRTFFYASVEIPLLDNLYLSGVCARQIWHSQITSISSFVQNLRKLTLWDCDNLKYLFTSSMVKSFGQLEVLQIWRCKKMLMVILMEELAENETMFPKLDTLELNNVPQLKRFCSNYNSLGEEYEPQRLNGSGSEVPAATQSILVKTKVTLVFPRVTYLKLSLPNLKSFFPQFYITRWPLLKRIHVEQCDKMKTFASEFPSIEITYGDNQLERQTQHPMFWIIKESFPCLEELKFKQNDSMKEIWHGQYPGLGTLEVPSIVLFKNLQNLEISRCHGLENLLSYSTAKSLVQLKRMSITNCNLVEEIVRCLEVEVKDGIVFNQLKYLKLCGLPKLLSFCAGKCDFEFLSLNDVIVMECPQMKYFSVGKTVTKELQTVQWINDEEKQGHWVDNDLNSTIKDLFIQKVGCLESRNLELSKFSELSETWKKNPEELTLLFKNLQCLEVCNCNNLSYLLTPNMALAFVQLEDLKIKDCAAMEQVVMVTGVEEVVETGLTFPRLKSILLEFCFKLSSFYVGSNALNFSLLEKITIKNCPKMFRFTSKFSSLQEKETTDGKSEETLVKEEPDIFIVPFFCDKVKFPKLELLKITSINIHQIWHNQISENPSSIQNLQGLKELVVEGCGNLKSLFTSSMIKSFEQLTKLQICNCKMMEIVILTEQLGKEERMSGIFFPKLDSLKLKELPILTRFCSGNFFEFSSLTELQISKCPMLKTFISSSIIRDNENGVNANAPYLFDEKVKFPKLELLKLTSINIHQVWPNEISENSSSIQNLKELEELVVEGCGNLKYLLTSSMVESFEQLTKLQICDCKMMEIVILTEELGEGERMSEIFFPRLHYLKLKELPILTRFCSGNFLEFSSLTDFQMSKCPMLNTFISSSIIGDIENGVNAYAPYLFDEKVKTPIWKTLALSSINIRQIWNSQLSSISSFAQHLTKLKVVNCCNLKYLLTFSMVKSFAQLEELMISECEIMEVVILIEGMAEEERIDRSMFPQLKTLVLNDLPQLATFCSNCDSLGEISESKRVNFGIGSQELLATESTSMETKATKVEFSPVTWLTLRLLPKFKYFFPQTHITEWPLLERLAVMECHEVQIVASKFSSIEMAHGDNQLERESEPLMFCISKATFPSLKHLAVKWNDNLKIWCGHHPEEYFGLEVLTLIGFPKHSAFPPPFFFESLPNLKELVVKDAFLSEIFQCEEVTAKEKPVYGYTSLSKLRLSKLHELTHLWKEESQLEADILNNLRSLKVQECSRLKNLVPSTVHFNKLQTLLVSECHGLVNLMRYSTAKSLGQLQRMKVANCEMIEEIVTCLGDAVKDDGIVFPKLWCLKLKGLPRLESFCSRNCNFKFSALQIAIVTKCPNMQIFSKGELSTPYLREVKLTADIYEDMDEDIEKKIDDILHGDQDDEDNEVERESCWDGDLNSTVQHLFEEKSAHNSKKSNGENSDHDAKEDDN